VGHFVDDHPYRSLEWCKMLSLLNRSLGLYNKTNNNYTKHLNK